MSETKKIQIAFNSREIFTLENLKKASGQTTVASVVRDALKFYEWCRVAVKEGWTIVAIRSYAGPGGEKRKEPLLPFEKSDG